MSVTFAGAVAVAVTIGGGVIVVDVVVVSSGISINLCQHITISTGSFPTSFSCHPHPRPRPRVILVSRVVDRVVHTLLGKSMNRAEEIPQSQSESQLES